MRGWEVTEIVTGVEAMTTRTDSRRIIESLANRWREQHLWLNDFLDEFRRWACHHSEPDSRRYAEAAARLVQLRERLQEHFQCEDQLADHFLGAREGLSPEADANRRQVKADHSRLFKRLDGLIDEFGRRRPPYESWTAAVEQVELFADVLEQHEEQEADSILWLIPR
jgi:hypothetical protein